jgi:hypothetical protein
MNTRMDSVCAFAVHILRLPKIVGTTLVALSLLGVTTGYAQSNVNGYIFGTVSGAGSNSKVIAVSAAAGIKREATPDSNGSYRITALPIGTYAVTLQTPGQPAQVFDNVNVNLGTGSSVNFSAGAQPTDKALQLEKYVVTGESISPRDLSSVDSVTVMRAETIATLPIERNTTAVALLAPSTTVGARTDAFGNLLSFGGASVSENTYFVNGFNLTNFRNGLGGGTVPFEFYDQFKIEEGGYSAEFGRSTGGALIGTTKRGSNTFTAGANVFFEPNSLYSHSPSTFKPDNTPFRDRSWDYTNSERANLYVGGPIIPNKLFYYGLYEARNEKSNNLTTSSTWVTRKSEQPFWGGKLDWNISDNHTLEMTAIGNKNTTDLETFGYTPDTRIIGATKGITYQKRGGSDFIYRYTGVITPDFTISALYGKSTANATDAGQGDGNPYILDNRSGSAVQLGSASQSLPTGLFDKRKAYRLDGEYHYSLGGSHTLRVGYDREDTSSYSLQYYSGGIYWAYNNRPASGVVDGVTIPATATAYARKRVLENGGEFKTYSTAYYAEDKWKLMNDRLLLSLGLRNDTFDNRNKYGTAFLKMSNQVAPRLGASFDLDADGKSKIYVNYGRYFLPVPSNTNIRFSGGELFTRQYYVLNGVNADGSPILGAPLGSGLPVPYTGEDGSVPNPLTTVANNLKPMYQDEFILGYQRALSNRLTVGVRGIYRNVTHFIEDEDVTFSNGDEVDVMMNPGKDLVIYHDFGDGKGPVKVSVPNSKAYLGLAYPPASRKYYALEFSFEKLAGEKWVLKGSYKWSHLYGNMEGLTLSDVGQADPTITQAYDYPQIMEGGYGDLNNDKRHSFKVFGQYKITPELSLGANFRLESGSPKVAVGYYPDQTVEAAGYGAAFHYVNGKFVPRGSLGTGPWVKNIDLSARYVPAWGQRKLSFGFDLFNLFNSSSATDFVSQAENGGVGVKYLPFGLPLNYQTPRYVRVSMSYKY